MSSNVLTSNSPSSSPSKPNTVVKVATNPVICPRNHHPRNPSAPPSHLPHTVTRSDSTPLHSTQSTPAVHGHIHLPPNKTPQAISSPVIQAKSVAIRVKRLPSPIAHDGVWACVNGGHKSFEVSGRARDGQGEAMAVTYMEFGYSAWYDNGDARWGIGYRREKGHLRENPMG
jgi:hypothetical protein